MRSAALRSGKEINKKGKDTNKSMSKSTKAEGVQEITIRKPKLVRTKITLVGETPLLVHAWSEKAKKEMLAAQQKASVAKKAKAIRDPFAEFVNAAYWVEGRPEDDTPEAFERAIKSGAKFGFPTIAVKMAALSSCYRAGLIQNQVGMKCHFYINGKDGVDAGTGSELAIIECANPELAGIPEDEPTKIVPELREDMVKIGGVSKVADLRYRPVFRNWKIHLSVSLIDTGCFTMESVINAIDLGGQMNGIGEWRMEKNGDFGRYHVEMGWV